MLPVLNAPHGLNYPIRLNAAAVSLGPATISPATHQGLSFTSTLNAPMALNYGAGLSEPAVTIGLAHMTGV